MAAGNFLPCLNGFTLLPAHDGQPYHVTPGDPGGATSYGITIATYGTYLGHPATTAQMQALDAASVAPIYQALVWNNVAGDALPLGVDLMVFDHAVLGGTATSAKALQQVLRVTVDGDIGPITEAAASGGGEVLIGKLAWNQELEYRSDADFSLFGNGWLARLDARVAAALAMLSK